MVTTNSIDNTVGDSDSGLTNTLTVQNTSNTASSQAQQLITVGGSSSGDAWTQWSVGSAASWALGIDNSDSDVLKMNYSASASVNPSSTPFIKFDGALARQTMTSSVANTSSVAVINSLDDANSQAAFTLNQTTNTGVNAFNASALNQGASARVAGRVVLQTSSQSLGLNIETLNDAGGATLDFYTGLPGAPVLTARQTALGSWLYPRQPAFLGYLAATATGKTGNGATYTLGTDALTESYDYGTNFNTNGTFTATDNGIYKLGAQITLSNTTIATSFVISIVTTLATYQSTFTRAAAATNQTVSIETQALMNATDTATVTITVTGEAADTVDILGGTTRSTYFYGKLEA